MRIDGPCRGQAEAHEPVTLRVCLEGVSPDGRERSHPAPRRARRAKADVRGSRCVRGERLAETRRPRCAHAITMT